MAEERKSYDAASQEMITAMSEGGIETCWDRDAKQKPHCKFGVQGICCRICFMGPCRITKKADRGVCGADANTIAARNFVRMIAGGAAAHSDHGRDVAHVFLETAKGNIPGYELKDKQKLMDIAGYLGVEVEGRSLQEVAIEIGEICMAEFGKPHGTLKFLQRAPEKRQKLWKELGVEPRAVDREIVEIMHRTHMGVDQEYHSLMVQGTRCAIGDGWGGSMIATELQDVLFGTPKPIRGVVNLGILKEDTVNIIVHGHEPALSEMIVVAAGDPEMLKLAGEKGAKGITLGGMCCTANEILMRHGIPTAGNFLQQELAIGTGAVEAMIVDVQCIMQGLTKTAECFHTRLVTTSPKGHIPGATHIEFNEENPIESAKEIVRTAIEAFPNRDKGRVRIPKHKMDMIAGFTHESVIYTLGGSFRTGYRPLNDNIINGRIRGIAGVVGCCNAKTMHNEFHVKVCRELIKNDVLVLQTGCSAIAAAMDGLMRPEAAEEHAGPGLAEVCRAVGIPPVLHCGSCVDNSRLLIAASGVVAQGGLGEDISDLPLAGAAPEWMSEKAISIGHYFVASGVYTVFGIGLPTSGAPEFQDYLFTGLEGELGGMWDVAADAKEMAAKMIAHIDKKRAALGIDKARERVLYDMDMRRELKV
jgi:carbon-monoxide dehydrogenase catalytic subunit